MTQKLLFDTSALIAFEQKNARAIELHSHGEHATSAIAVMEFDQSFNEPFEIQFPKFKVIPFGLAEAKIAAEKMREIRPLFAALVKDLSKSQTKDYMARVSLDLMIGATALVNGYTVVNQNPSDFAHFKRLKTIVI